MGKKIFTENEKLVLDFALRGLDSGYGVPNDLEDDMDNEEFFEALNSLREYFDENS